MRPSQKSDGKKYLVQKWDCTVGEGSNLRRTACSREVPRCSCGTQRNTCATDPDNCRADSSGATDSITAYRWSCEAESPNPQRSTEICEEEIPAILSIQRATSSVAEGENADFTITANRPITLTANLQCREQRNFSDTLTSSYTTRTVTMTNTSTATHTEATVDDQINDGGNGSITCRLRSGTGYSVGHPASSTLSVIDDDTPP